MKNTLATVQSLASHSLRTASDLKEAREKLDVTTVLLSNRKYQILLGELANVGANPGRTALDMLDLGNPDLDWTKLAAGMGVEAARAESCERFADLFAQANSRKGPFLIELMI